MLLLMNVKRWIYFKNLLLLKIYFLKVSGKESIAVEAFGRALAKLPTIICDNAGLDSAEIVTQIRAEQAKGHHNIGIGREFLI